jgi:hypothetical protein
MNDNKLWVSHRMMLPPVREIDTHYCGECRYFVQTQGVYEIRTGCVVRIERYLKRWRRPPEMIQLKEILRLVGREGLPEVLDRGSDPEWQACGEWAVKMR